MYVTANPDRTYNRHFAGYHGIQYKTNFRNYLKQKKHTKTYYYLNWCWCLVLYDTEKGNRKRKECVFGCFKVSNAIRLRQLNETILCNIHYYNNIGKCVRGVPAKTKISNFGALLFCFSRYIVRD